MTVGGFWEVWRAADKPVLAALLFLSVVVHIFVGADKLWRVLLAMGFKLPFADVLRLRLGSGPLRILLPVDAGEILNILFFRRYKKMAVADASGACFFDRGLNLLGSTFWLILGLILMAAKTSETAPKVLSIICVGLVYGLFLFASPVHRLIIQTGERIHEKAGEFAKGMLLPFSRCSPGQKLFFCAYGIIFQARPLIVCYLLFASLGIYPDLNIFIAFASLTVFAGHLPTASGIGPREAALILLFAGCAPASTLFAIGAAMSLFVHIIPMMAGIPWLRWFFMGIAAGSEQP